jgi:hypothetical protein
MREMVRARYIDVDRLVMKKPWWYGYKGAYREQIQGFSNMLFGHSIASRIKGTLRSAGILTRPKL